MSTLLRNVTDVVGLFTKLAERAAAIGVLVVAGWDDDDTGSYDPLITP